MSDGSVINSDAYWDGRFSVDWESFDGPKQSRFFARLAVKNIPPWLIEQIRRQSLTVADWGCAQGDGTDSLASHIDPRQLVGIDFSEVAIRQAKERYPAIRFLAENWIGDASDEVENFDVVFSSNTLEHFHNPWEILESLGVRAKKAVVLALPYREMDRIDEHFYSFLPENVPLELSNGFGLIWARVVDCKPIENTHWSGEQIFLVYAEKSWISSLKLTLNDCEIGQDDALSVIASQRIAIHDSNKQIEEKFRVVAEACNSEIANLTQDLQKRDVEIEHFKEQISAKEERICSLCNDLSTRESQIANLQNGLAARDTEIEGFKAALKDGGEKSALLVQQLKLVQDRVMHLENEQKLNIEKIDGFVKSRSWRITRPLRVFGRFYRSLFDVSERYQLLKSIYWKLPNFARAGLNKQRYKYVSRNLHAKDALALASNHSQSGVKPGWALAANAAEKVAIIPCGFEFDELVNQRPINAAKYFSQQGYVVLFIAWQWSKGEPLKNLPGQVWPGIYQVPLFDFIDFESSLSSRQVDALYLLTMPARVLAELAPGLRGRGYSIVYDIMDEWEEFHKTGQAPWFERDVELNLVLQSDVVSAVAPALVKKFSAIRDDIQLIGNGYSENILGPEFRAIAGRDAEGPTRVGYFGHLTDAWFDWSVVFALAKANPEIHFEMIGYGEPQWVHERVAKIDNIKLLGKIHPKQLHTHVRRWKFGIIPFVEGDLARAVDPIKIYEYLYFGLPTFATGIEHLASYPRVSFSTSAQATDSFERFLRTGTAQEEGLKEFLENTTWDARFSQLQKSLSRKMILGSMYAT